MSCLTLPLGLAILQNFVSNSVVPVEQGLMPACVGGWQGMSQNLDTSLLLWENKNLAISVWRVVSWADSNKTTYQASPPNHIHYWLCYPGWKGPCACKWLAMAEGLTSKGMYPDEQDDCRFARTSQEPAYGAQPWCLAREGHIRSLSVEPGASPPSVNKQLLL